VGEIDKTYLQNLVEKLEALIGRKLRTLVLSAAEYEKLRETLAKSPVLVLWKREAEETCP
jgi:hypothetical protein